MGLLGSIRKKVSSPRFRMKRKRPESDVFLKETSTCECSQDTFSAMDSSVDSSFYDTKSRVLRESDDEDTQELLTPLTSFVFDDRPIMVSDDDTGDDVDGHAKMLLDIEDDDDTQDTSMVDSEEDDPKQTEVASEHGRVNKCLFDSDSDDHPNYVSASSGDASSSDDESELESKSPSKKERAMPPSPPFVRSHTPPDALLPTHSRIKSEGQLMHIFHDELSTLYEEPNNKSEDDDSQSQNSIESTSSDLQLDKTLDESNMRARWDYALQLMSRVGQCEPTGLLYNSLAELVPPMMRVTTGEDVDLEIAEI